MGTRGSCNEVLDGWAFVLSEDRGSITWTACISCFRRSRVAGSKEEKIWNSGVPMISPFVMAKASFEALLTYSMCSSGPIMRTGSGTLSRILMVDSSRYFTSWVFNSTWLSNPANCDASCWFIRLTSSANSSISSPVDNVRGSRYSPLPICRAAS